MYAQTVDHALRGTGTETFEAIDMLRKADPGKYQPENGADYGKSRLGQSLQQIGQLLKADIGTEVLFVDCGGWDNHVNEGGAQGQLSNLLRDLGQGMAAFRQDMGDRMENIVFVTMSEFGRTAKENGNRGTDHGHANCMFVMGGDVKGGKVYGRWPGLRRRPAERRPRPGADHGFPLGAGRNSAQAQRRERSRAGVSGLRQRPAQIYRADSRVGR